jgi:hypothetical protein
LIIGFHSINARFEWRETKILTLTGHMSMLNRKEKKSLLQKS